MSSKRMKDNLGLVVCPAEYMLLSFDRARVHDTCTRGGGGEGENALRRVHVSMG